MWNPRQFQVLFYTFLIDARHEIVAVVALTAGIFLKSEAVHLFFLAAKFKSRIPEERYFSNLFLGLNCKNMQEYVRISWEQFFPVGLWQVQIPGRCVPDRETVEEAWPGAGNTLL